MEKIKALANYLKIKEDEIEKSPYSKNKFDTPKGTYIVCTQDEAYDLAVEYIEDCFDDMGLEAFSPNFQGWILTWCLKTKFIEDMMRQDYEDYVYDIEDENSNDFDNRLIEEMYDNDILTDDDFELNEDGEIDYYTLKETVNLDDKRSEYINELVDSIDPSDWLQDVYGTGEDLSNFVKNYAYQLLNFEKITKECISIDGVANFIAPYDNEEIELEDDLFAYRTN